MMKAIRYLFSSLLFAGFFMPASYAQTVIDPDNFQHELLIELLQQKTDSARRTHGLPGWKQHEVLSKAAADHALYLLKEGSLTHFQKEKAKYSPQDRVLFFGGKGLYTGENVAEHPILVPLYKINGQTIDRVTTYEESALLFVQQWLGSPSHRKNLLKAQYELNGVGVAYDEKTQRIYAVQLFSPPPARE